jgi:hypothetical protein
MLVGRLLTGAFLVVVNSLRWSLSAMYQCSSGEVHEEEVYEVQHDAVSSMVLAAVRLLGR